MNAPQNPINKKAASNNRKVLVLATETCAYPGLNYVGQTHAEYASSFHVVRIPSPVVFPEKFYLDAFDKGIDAIIIMSCGHECPYPGAYDRMAQRVSAVHKMMKEKGIDIKRLRLCAICTVCAKQCLKEFGLMTDALDALDCEK